MTTGSTEKDLRDRLEDVAGGAGPETVAVNWSEADPETRPDGVVWDPEERTLQYDLWDAQRQARDAVEDGPDIVAFLGGYGSGKSIFGARWTIKTALEHPGGRFLVMGQSFAEARDTTFSKFFEQLPGERTALRTSGFNGPETSPIVRDYNRQKRRVTLINDAEIILGSADKYSRFAGAEFSGIWCDEPSHYGDTLHELTDMLTTRLRGIDGPKLMVWTLTGEGYNAAWEILENREGPDGDPIGLDIDLIRASVLENPYLAAEDKERFKRKYEGTSKEQQALHGAFVEASGALLNREALTFQPIHEAPDGPYIVHIGVDLGFVGSTKQAEANDTDYTAVVVAFVSSDDPSRVYLTDCDRRRGLTLRETIAWLRKIGSAVDARMIWKIEDVAGSKYAVQEARQELPGRVQAVTPSGSKADRILDMSVLFESGQVVLANHNDPTDGPRGYDERWRAWVDEWTQFGTDDAHDDLLDATFYALENISRGGLGKMASADPWGK